MTLAGFNRCVKCRAKIPLRKRGGKYITRCTACVKRAQIERGKNLQGTLSQESETRRQQRMGDAMRKRWESVPPEERTARMKNAAAHRTLPVQRESARKAHEAYMVKTSKEQRLAFHDKGALVRKLKHAQRVKERLESGASTCRSCTCVLPLKYFAFKKGYARPYCAACRSIQEKHGYFPVLLKRSRTLHLPTTFRGFRCGMSKEIYERYWLPLGLIDSTIQSPASPQEPS
jgi:hypothetical protein